MGNFRFDLDAQASKKAFPHYWEKCVGSCHGYTALREDYRQMLRKAHDELGFEYVRFHGILCDDMSVVQENEPGVYTYNYFNIDCVLDFLLDIGMKPFMELGFMPYAFASGDQKLFHYNANVTPPKDYGLWDAFIGDFMQHLVARYGLEEVSQWLFEVWNEPNLKVFFSGTKDDYLTLYEHTARAIKKAEPDLKVGGPATAFNSWVPDLIAFCEKKDVPLDFISTHHYPTDDPLWDSGMTLEDFFADVRKQVEEGDEDAARKAKLYHRGILTDMVVRTKQQAGKYPLYYTEWNTSATLGDPVHDVPYSAALVVKTVLDNAGMVESYSFWTFSDIFEESPQKVGEFHGGFGLMSVHGVPKPTYRAFEFLHNLGESAYPTVPEQDTVGLRMTDSKDGGLTVIAYNHQIPDEFIEDATLRVVICGATVSKASILRIDENHANAHKAWQEMGSPKYPSRDEVLALKEASQTREEELPLSVQANGVSFTFELPAHGVALIRLS